MKMINNLKNKYKNKDIYVLASGSSMNHVEKSFFENKITVGINRVCMFFDCNYTVTKDPEGFDLIMNSSVNKNNQVVVSKYRYGTRPRLNKGIDSFLYFDHFNKPGQRPEVDKIDKDKDMLVVSHSTTTSGIHLAAYLGAKNIILCGHDCGTINGESVISGYYSKMKPHQVTMEGYNKWLKTIKQDTINVSRKIEVEYGCNILSLNPFIFLDLEGNKYE